MADILVSVSMSIHVCNISCQVTIIVYHSPDATVYTPPEVLKIPTATGLPSQHMNDLLRGRECK